jgi:hypothetical protein
VEPLRRNRLSRAMAVLFDMAQSPSLVANLGTGIERVLGGRTLESGGPAGRVTGKARIDWLRD